MEKSENTIPYECELNPISDVVNGVTKRKFAVITANFNEHDHLPYSGNKLNFEDNSITYNFQPKITFTDNATILHSDTLIVNNTDILSTIKTLQISIILLLSVTIISFLLK
jgi:hypothetical protein